jgi:hypothetical protein
MTSPGSQVREAIGRQTVRFRVSGLRRITARPFGLTTGDTAVMLGDESSSTGLVAEIRAAVTRAPVRLDSISLLYGDCLDLSAPFVEVITRPGPGPFRFATTWHSRSPSRTRRSPWSAAARFRTCRTLTWSLTLSRSALAGLASWKTFLNAWTGSPGRR